MYIKVVELIFIYDIIYLIEPYLQNITNIKYYQKKN